MPETVTVADVALRLFCALLASAAIGLNREAKGQAAGLRTTVLVGLAAALVGIEANLLLSTHRPAGVAYTTLDVLRLPLGLLSGVGFLGAGAIVRRGDMVRGVTTAATIWFISIACVCIGAGQIGLGVAGAALAFAVLWLLKLVDRAMSHAAQFGLSVCATREGPGEAEVRDRFVAAGYRWVACRIAEEDNGRRYSLDAVLGRRIRGDAPTEAPEVFRALVRTPGVERAEWRTRELSID
jgi:putative Mg2+ transporter-C (MgtC) family protein